MFSTSSAKEKCSKAFSCRLFGAELQANTVMKQISFGRIELGVWIIIIDLIIYNKIMISVLSNLGYKRSSATPF